MKSVNLVFVIGLVKAAFGTDMIDMNYLKDGCLITVMMFIAVPLVQGKALIFLFGVALGMAIEMNNEREK